MNKKGFTLVELVVCIAILAILAGLAIPRFIAMQEEARGAKLLADMRTIESMAVAYASQHEGEYPQVLTTNTSTNFGKYNDFKNYFNGGYPKPPRGIVAITGNDGKIYRYDLSSRQFFYGYNSQKRQNVDFQYATCDGKSIIEFQGGKKGNTNGSEPLKDAKPVTPNP